MMLFAPGMMVISNQSRVGSVRLLMHRWLSRLGGVGLLH